MPPVLRVSLSIMQLTGRPHAGAPASFLSHSSARTQSNLPPLPTHRASDAGAGALAQPLHRNSTSKLHTAGAPHKKKRRMAQAAATRQRLTATLTLPSSARRAHISQAAPISGPILHACLPGRRNRTHCAGGYREQVQARPWRQTTRHSTTVCALHRTADTLSHTQPAGSQNAHAVR